MVKIILHKLGGALLTVVMIWIMTGSLIEFHQRYVFDNHADLWELQATHIHGKDLKKFLRLYSKSCPNQLSIDFQVNGTNFSASLVNFNLNKKTIFSRYLFDLHTPEYITDLSLRGPPVV
ncbi:MAG: hypothetical protein R2750_06315 [Bacteroidales bacterium]